MKRWIFLIAAAVAVSACGDELTRPSEQAVLTPDHMASALSGEDVEFTGRYIVLGRGWMLPGDLGQKVSAAGGTLVKTLPQVGVAVVEATDPAFAANARRIYGVESVTPDMILQWVDPPQVEGAMEPEYVTPSADLADGAAFYSFQWAPRAIQAPEAWDAGYTGAGVRVAIVDGAVYDGHKDLIPNLDVDASASFVPGYAWNEDTGTFWHGTHVAGIVGAAGQYAAVGIAPNATLIGVKALHNGSGAFEWIMDAILYSATSLEDGGAGAHIINMSLGATINYRNNWHAPGFREAFRELEKALDRTTRWAFEQGTLVIASAGNNGYNYDVSKELFKIPAENHGVVAVGSTAPLGWAKGATNFDRFAYYSDHGKSLLDVAAPGGTPGLVVENGDWSICTMAGTYVTLTRYCYVFDYVLSTVRGSSNSGTWVSWAYGTSMAAPAASGVAALIIEKNGGNMQPHAVAAALQSSAIDLGKPGQDEYYGHGWVNALRAVR